MDETPSLCPPLRQCPELLWNEQNPWEVFHSAWINTIVRHLNGVVLPGNFRAVPQVHLGSFVEADVAAFIRDHGDGVDSPFDQKLASFNGRTTAIWAAPEAVQTLDIELPAQDVFEVRVFDDRQGMRLVAVVELVSPANKDRPEPRQAFAAKCAGYLQERVGVVVVDIVTARHANLHQELLAMFGLPLAKTAATDLYAVAYCNRKAQGKWQLKLWPAPLTMGRPLPEMPLWLASDPAVPLDLEKSYEETAQVLRIE